MQQLQLPENFIGQRIDKAFSDYFGLSRNFFHNLFERGLIKLRCYDATMLQGHNTQKLGSTEARKHRSTETPKPIKKSHKVEGGEIFELPELSRYEDNQILSECPKIDLEIKHETSDYIVLYKPKGVLSHPKTLFDLHEPSVVGFLYHKYGNLPDSGGFIRAGIIHRLDKDTDGLMMMAKTEKGLKYFKELFNEKALQATSSQQPATSSTDAGLHKYYRAICELTKEGEKRLQIQHETGSTKQRVVLQSLIYPKVPVVGYPKMGVTKIRNYKLGVRNGKKVVEFDIELLTGRTHQIRYHLAEIGLPIVGDWLYGKAASYQLPVASKQHEEIRVENNSELRTSNSELLLTAYGLEFVDCDGLDQKFYI